MSTCIFVSDLHGDLDRYRKLLAVIAAEAPRAVFLGGDLLPGGNVLNATLDFGHEDFINDYLAASFARLRASMGDRFPRLFIILGNDDCRAEEAAMLDAAARGAWEYVHNRAARLDEFDVYGYTYVPPSPFLLKDWERYDVSRYVPTGSVSPEEGMRTIPVSEHEARYATIQEDLERLVADAPLDRAILLFHAPPYDTSLDRAALDGRMIEHVPLRVHVGSVAIRRFVEQRQPLLTLHGHIHESARLTGRWSEQIGRTVCLSAAHDGPELALVRFSPQQPATATRELL
jgi:Icc-related predicted phosphoesterase